MSHKDEVTISLDEHGHAVGQLDMAPVDMVRRLRIICRIFLLVFLVRTPYYPYSSLSL